MRGSERWDHPEMASHVTSDENPYRPPGATTREIERPGRRIGWKLYFLLLATGIPLSLLGDGLAWMQGLDLIDVGVTATGLAGLFGYAFRRRLASLAFWRRWLPVQIGWDMLLVLVFEPLGLAQQTPGSEISSGFEWTIAAALVLPFYLALFRYGFRSPEIWSPS